MTIIIRIKTTVKFSEETHIFQILTLLQLKMRVKYGQIPPDSLTHPWVYLLPFYYSSSMVSENNQIYVSQFLRFLNASISYSFNNSAHVSPQKN